MVGNQVGQGVHLLRAGVAGSRPQRTERHLRPLQRVLQFSPVVGYVFGRPSGQVHKDRACRQSDRLHLVTRLLEGISRPAQLPRHIFYDPSRERVRFRHPERQGSDRGLWHQLNTLFCGRPGRHRGRGGPGRGLTCRSKAARPVTCPPKGTGPSRGRTLRPFSVWFVISRRDPAGRFQGITATVQVTNDCWLGDFTDARREVSNHSEKRPTVAPKRPMWLAKTLYRARPCKISAISVPDTGFPVSRSRFSVHTEPPRQSGGRGTRARRCRRRPGRSPARRSGRTSEPRARSHRNDAGGPRPRHRLRVPPSGRAGGAPRPAHGLRQ